MKRILIGGQAVMEGVMMRNGSKYAIAVRKPDQTIEVKVQNAASIKDKYSILKIPIVRGVVSFVESLSGGAKALTFSAQFYVKDEEKTKFEQFLEDKFQEKAEWIQNVFTMLLAFILAIGIFMILPYLLTGFLENILHNHTLVLILEGILRIAIFLGYVLLISGLEDIQRVFMYHGAEHKTINCLEHGEDLTPENVKKYSRLHKRCGTSFLFIVMFISIFFFFFIQTDSVLLKIVYRLLLIPVIAGVSYEFLHFAGTSDSKILSVLSKPGLMLQKLTTREPDLDMIEVAIKSVESVMDWKSYVEAIRNGEIED